MLGGSLNTPADRAVGRSLTDRLPVLVPLARAHRAFSRHAVAAMLRQGIRQFVDLGSGLPTVEHVHHVAQAEHPQARVVYVDHDPDTVAQAELLLRDNPFAAAVRADLRQPLTLLDAVVRTGLLDVTEPTGLLAVDVLHLVPDREDPAGLLRRYERLLAPGSCLALSHCLAGAAATLVQQRLGELAHTGALFPRTRAALRAWLASFTLLDPGLADLPWPDSAPPPDEPDSALAVCALALVGSAGQRPARPAADENPVCPAGRRSTVRAMSSPPPAGTIRPATPEDATALAEIHVASWQAAYAGHLPDGFLRNLSVADRQRSWQQWLAATDQASSVLVAEADEHVVAGFAAIGPSRDDNAAPGTGELRSIYLHPKHWGRGLGRLLHDQAIEALRQRRFRQATLWVLASNTRARRFYETAGWAVDGATRTDTSRDGTVLFDEVRYWRDLPPESV
ncbi:L-amino acid N-acyltransferase YncA [Goodfellowiella coeruleoviolacea]|uniref:L-amino acid N-acyltransferase YncA n=1 Tax=Goodfellowiella coeruleoviolacea TaxID=334858 RepID=A0AAE3G9W3_9PSEU|nr:L-amino acid N-acyltransferase YncA [Goodfellowiella coeruleoviolacea]